jgi:hypothetical protein
MPLENLDGLIYLGGEVASRLFQGYLKDIIFFTKCLETKEIKKIYDIRSDKNSKLKTNDVKYFIKLLI